jgi:uncharacterized membrane-anchored protein YhcB (DUF1043 family)
MKKILGFLLGFLIGTCIMIPLILLKLENNKLNNEIGRLKQDIIEYRWQLEQMPLIMESVKDEWCDNE